MDDDAKYEVPITALEVGQRIKARSGMMGTCTRATLGFIEIKLDDGGHETLTWNATAGRWELRYLPPPL